MIAIARATGVYPKRDFMHLGNRSEHFIVGQSDFLARDGNALISSGLYDDTELARMEVAARQERSEEWGDSIAFIPLDSPEYVDRGDGAVPAWNLGFCQFISTVPERLAASHFTSGVIQEVDRMALSDKDLKAFNDLFGDEERAAAWLSKHVENVEDAIEDAGMLTRTVDELVEDPVEEPVEIIPTEEFVSVAPLIEIAEDEIDVLIARSLEPVLDRIQAMSEQMSELVLTVQTLSESSHDATVEVKERLVALEKEEEDKHREWMEDLPAKTMVRITHRPSDPDRDNGAPESMDDRAAAALEI
jgi:hypothetical protein